MSDLRFVLALALAGCFALAGAFWFGGWIAIALEIIALVIVLVVAIKNATHPHR